MTSDRAIRVLFPGRDQQLSCREILVHSQLWTASTACSHLWSGEKVNLGEEAILIILISYMGWNAKHYFSVVPYVIQEIV